MRGVNAGSTSKVSDLSQENFRCSDGSGMLIDDPLGEGSNASSTNSELWRAEISFSEMRRNSNAQEWDPRYKPGPDQLK